MTFDIQGFLLASTAINWRDLAQEYFIRQYSELKEKYDQLRTQYGVLTSKYEQLRREHTSLTTRHEALVREHNWLGEKHKTLDERYNQLSKIYFDLRRNYSNATTALQKIGEVAGEILGPDKSKIGQLEEPSAPEKTVV